MVLRFIENERDRHDETDESAVVSDVLGSDYSAATRWNVTNAEWLKIGSLENALMVLDRLIHLLPPAICEQLDPLLYAKIVRVFNAIANIEVHEAIVPAQHYQRLDPSAPAKEAR